MDLDGGSKKIVGQPTPGGHKNKYRVGGIYEWQPETQVFGHRLTRSKSGRTVSTVTEAVCLFLRGELCSPALEVLDKIIEEIIK